MSTPQNAPAPVADIMSVLSVAAIAAGPITAHPTTESWKTALTLAAAEINTLISSPRSPLRQAVSDAGSMRTIDVTLVGVTLDQKANRAAVRFISDPPSTYSKEPDHSEIARTDRLENAEAAALANKISQLGQSGQKVRLTIVNRDQEKSENGKGFRTIVGADAVA